MKTTLTPLRGPFLSLYAVDQDGNLWKANNERQAQNGFYKALTPLRQREGVPKTLMWRVKSKGVTFEFRQDTNKELQGNTLARIVEGLEVYRKAMKEPQ